MAVKGLKQDGWRNCIFFCLPSLISSLVFVQISMHTTASTQWNFYRTSSFGLLLMDVYIRYPYVLFVICVLN